MIIAQPIILPGHDHPLFLWAINQLSGYCPTLFWWGEGICCLNVSINSLPNADTIPVRITYTQIFGVWHYSCQDFQAIPERAWFHKNNPLSLAGASQYAGSDLETGCLMQTCELAGSGSSGWCINILLFSLIRKHLDGLTHIYDRCITTMKLA